MTWYLWFRRFQAVPARFDLRETWPTRAPVRCRCAESQSVALVLPVPARRSCQYPLTKRDTLCDPLACLLSYVGGVRMRHLPAPSRSRSSRSSHSGRRRRRPSHPQTPVAAPPAQPQAPRASSQALPSRPIRSRPTIFRLSSMAIFALQLERSDIAGATVLVMKDGNVIFQKGYGFADVKTRKPVDPANTMFRIASISKLFTWISGDAAGGAGQAQSRHRRQSISRFPITPAFNKPITLRNLMTHTSGFEEVLNQIIILDAKDKPSLPRLLDCQPAAAAVSAGPGYGVFQLRRIAGQLHRAARQRRAICAVRPGAHFHAAENDPFHLLPAGAEAAGAVRFPGLPG